MAGLKVSILQGRYKNKKITIPEKIKGHNAVTPHKIKEAAFQIIRNIIASPETSVFLDLFAGSGQMGFEALSRDFKSILFFDISQERLYFAKEWAMQNLHEDDIKKCKFENKDSIRMFSEITTRDSENFQDMVLFADAPYNFIYKKRLVIDFLMEAYISTLPQWQAIHPLLLIQTSKSDIIKSDWFSTEENFQKQSPGISIKYYHYGKNILIAIKKDLPEDIF